MRTRAILSLAIITILVTSIIPVSPTVELDDAKSMFFADSEPELLIQTASASGHFNDSNHIEAVPGGWVVAGDTRGDMTFGSFQLQATSVYNTQMGADSYVASIDDQGVWQWAIKPDATQGLTIINSMTASVAGDIYVGGQIFGDVSFGPILLSSQNAYGDGFIAKIDPTGQWVWATMFVSPYVSGGTSANLSQVEGLAESFSGSLYVSGYHRGVTDFGGISKNNSDYEFFLADLDRMSGTLNWVSTAGGIGTDIGGMIDLDSMGNIWQVGVTSGTFTANAKSHQAVSQQDAVIVKWSSTGVVQDVIGLASAAGELNIAEDMIVTQNDDVVVSGVFLGSLDAGNQNTLTDKGQGDGFVVKILKSGSSAWATSAGASSGTQWIYAVEETSNGDLIAGGMIAVPTDFGIHVGNTNGGADFFMAQLDSNGNWDWVENLGSTADDVLGDISVNMTDHPAAFGAFQGTINKGTQSVTSSGGVDLVIWSLDPVNNADSDNDGVNDLTDNCPNTNNPLQVDSDLDGDGDECDYDDDNDGITDYSGDDCPRGGAWNWTSDSTTDFDNDGCKDSSEDDDDDNDGIDDDDDGCLSSYTAPRNWWISDTTNDVDQDGCRDADEDDNDDGDNYTDSQDDCIKVAGSSSLGNYIGCPDSDDDGWADFEDSCVDEHGNSSMNGLIACPDDDGDGYANSDDDLPDDKTQWRDYDGDTYGDNPDGNTPDSCVIDEGTSTLDRYGCPDPDGDGYSNEDDTWSIADGADAFPFDETQWSDWDEDEYGDNYANLSWIDRGENWPGEYYQYARDQDACPTLPGDSWQDDIFGCPDGDSDGWADFMDAFPADPDNYLDSDGDKIADGNDDCPDDEGYSEFDVVGCPDFDEDGWGDPDVGSDWRPKDSTQWADSDGDGYGDNPEGTNPDSCVNEAGFDKLWNSFQGGVMGCLDTDGDGWADTIDAFANESTQWNDTDGDGFGDNPNGRNSDKCPDVPGVEKEDGCEAVIIESSGSSILTYGGIGVGVLLIAIVVGLLIMRRMESDDDKEWAEHQSIPEMPNMNAMPVGQGLYSQQAQASTAVNTGLYAQQQAASPNIGELAGNQAVTPQPVAEPTVVQQWTDANGNTWRSMTDSSTLWWNGTDWQKVQ